MIVHPSKLKVGDVIMLDDIVTQKDNLAEGKPGGPVRYTIAARREIQESGKLFTFSLFELRREEERRFLLFKLVDDLLDIRIYKLNGWIMPDSREDLLSAGCEQLFQDVDHPLDSEGIGNLEWADQIQLSAGDADVIYAKKHQTAYGTTTEIPLKSAVKYPLFTGVTEYSTIDQADCSEIMIIETSGWVEFLEGWPIRETDLDILQG